MYNRVTFRDSVIGKHRRHQFPRRVPNIRLCAPVRPAYPNGQIAPLRVAAPVLERNAAAVHIQRHAEIAIYRV